MKAFGCNQHKTLPQARHRSVKHLSEASECCSARRATKRAKRQRHSDIFRRADEDRYHRQVCKAELNETSETAAEDSRDDNRLQQAVLQRNFPVSGMRPWSFLIPTLDEVATSKDWHLKVADWKTFWAMFNNWLWVYQQLVYYEENNLGLDPDVEEQMDWLQIDRYTLSGRVDKLVGVIDGVVDRLQELKQMGYPIPDEIAGKFPGFTGSRTRKYKVNDQGETYVEFGKIESNQPMFDAKPIVEEKMDSSGFSDASRPWDNWDEWEHRVYAEKQRMHRQKQAKFAKKQAEVGKWKHLVVSPTTDSRWAEDSYFYPINERDYTHEEIMRTVRLRGKAVDPLKIPIQIVDPDTYADGFREGVHYVPDTIDYIRDIGHLAETEEELIGERLDNLPSATLDEEFADSADSTLDELNDLEDGPAMEGMNAVVGGEEAALEEEDN